MDRRTLPRPVVAVVALVLAPLAAAQVQIIEDIQYESPGSSRNYLDVIRPVQGPDPSKPTLVHIHGGAWHAYDKTADRPVYIELASRGYAIVACNYQLSTPTSPSFPQAIHDVKNVTRWVKLHGSQYGLSPVVIVSGPSAGGHLAMMAAMTTGQFETLPPPAGGYRPAGFIQIAGFSDLEWHVVNYGQEWMFTQFLGAVYNPEDPQLYRAASPIFYVNPCDPPGALIHGTADTVVPHGHSERMTAAMQSAGIFAELDLVIGAWHSYQAFGGNLGIANRMDQMAQLLSPHLATSDLTGDGLLNIADFGAMLQFFAAADPRADINRDGSLNVADFSAFLQLYARQCEGPG